MELSNCRFVTVLAALYVTCAMALNTGFLVACPNMTVRPNSPCVIQAKVCPIPNMQVCSTKGEDVQPGNFQCDSPNAGTQCTGSGQFAPCRTECACGRVNGVCILVPPCQAFNSETKVPVGCPPSP